MTYQNQMNNLKIENMEEIITMMIQVFKENQNKPMTVEHLIDYYLKNKQLPFGTPATERQLKEAITTIHRNGTVINRKTKRVLTVN